MKNNKIGKIVAIVVSVLVTILLITFFCYLTRVFLDDISIKGNIFVLLISLILICLPVIKSVKNFILMLKGKKKISSNILSELLLIPGSLIYLFVVVFIICVIATIIPVKNYHYYKQLYSSDNELIKNFPNDVPSNAYNIEFYYEPSFLQKGKIMNLYYKIDNEIIKEYKDKYKGLEIIDDKINIDNLDKLYLNSKIQLNDNYRLYILYSECDDSDYCNHGSYSYVAINEVTSECIFAIYEW